MKRHPVVTEGQPKGVEEVYECATGSALVVLSRTSASMVFYSWLSAPFPLFYFHMIFQ